MCESTQKIVHDRGPPKITHDFFLVAPVKIARLYNHSPGLSLLQSLFHIETLPLHAAGAREIKIDQSRFSGREKIYCPHVNVSWQERHWNQATFLIGDGMKYSQKGIYNSQNHITLQNVKNMKHFVSPTSNSPPKMVVPRTSPGRIIVVLFWTKYAVPRQIKSGIL